jgi:hypothetical protein
VPFNTKDQPRQIMAVKGPEKAAESIGKPYQKPVKILIFADRP